MGQRHQVYVRLPKKFYNKGNPNNKGSEVIGVHHQWLYGRGALAKLKSFISFCLKADEYNPFSSQLYSPQSCLIALYSLDMDECQFHPVYPLDEECADPMKGDNNNGITIIDLSDFTDDKVKKGKFVIKYCFMSLHHLECLDDGLSDEWNDKESNHLSPLSAEEYLRLHYPAIKRGVKVSEDEAECRKLIAFFAKQTKVKVLTKKEAKAIFPKGLRR